MGELCALAYVIQLEALDRQAQAFMTASAVAAALSGGEAEVVDPADMRAAFDAQLCGEPEAEDDKALLLEGIGLRGRQR